ncbi:MAG: hypothetical protein Q4B54_08885 [Coriobacteriales bacterium]|nr:hypothetical protein [Coriobacteriales bacterium]
MRRKRQEAAGALASMAHKDVEFVVPVADVLVDALTVPEAQTRWKCLDALTCIADVHPELVTDAFAGAEESLFDESAAGVRLAAFEFLARYGSTSSERSLEVWPLIGEAVQCYHGDSEYRKMLISLRDFARGNIDKEVKASLAERMSFDAKNGEGFIRAYSAEICAIAKG